MTTLESNRCYACSKLFCCSDCCIDHIKKKHPGRESKCPLCRSERLMVKNFDNQEFLCHVVFHHLPLRCHFCGEKFSNCEDLRRLGNCNHRFLNRQTIVGTTIRENDNEKSIVKSPDTPSPHDTTPRNVFSIAAKQSPSIKTDYNGNFGNFVSPPELARNTSTPMHVNLAGNTNFAFKTPRSPFYKTPKTAVNHTTKNLRRTQTTEIKEENLGKTVNSTNLDSTDSIYYSPSSLSSKSATNVDQRTPLRSILSNNSFNRDRSQSTIANKMLGAMKDIDEDAGREHIEEINDMELTDVACNVIDDDCQSRPENLENLNSRPNRDIRDSVKRVRFYDQFHAKTQEECVYDGEILNASDSDEFFEARQSFSEFSSAIVDGLSSGIFVDGLSTSGALIDRENEENLVKEEIERVATTKSLEIVKTVGNEIAESSSSVTSSSSSSRVVMMVVVENNNGAVDANQLIPLIDSSLKKLKSVGNGDGNSRANSQSGTNVLTATTTDAKNEHSGTTMVSVDSYMSVSTVECFSTPDTTVNNGSQSGRNFFDSPTQSATGSIFSAMAQAMRTAFRSFAGGKSSKTISREPVSQIDNSALLSSSLDSSGSSSCVLENLASALVPRTAKRSRDTDDSPLPRTTEPIDPLNDVRSPVHKRPRGWYKIRAREPIARMRNSPVTSPRGVSSERQCFQQGSLSVGDTILPLPSRAHQSTQTD